MLGITNRLAPSLRVFLSPPTRPKIQQKRGIALPSYIPPHNYEAKEVGTYGTFDYRVFFSEKGKPISPWHDIPLEAGKTELNDRVFNYINEISRGKVEKMEITLKEEWNPIKQDVKKGVLRKINYHPYLWNYGAFPRTWEDPESVSPDTSLLGDGDPVDVVEVGKYTHKIGDVVRVKVIGALGLIDEGETDWKIIAIDIRDPDAININSPQDLEEHKKGCIAGIRDFFINYKVPDGKPKNVLAFDGEVKDQAFAFKVLEECHTQYKKIFTKDYGYSLKRKTEE